MQQEIAHGEVTWCVNSTGTNYPGFVDQLTDVHNQYEARVGIRQRQVAWGSPTDTGCMIQHNLIYNHPCGAGCAAWVYYANWPVVIEYKVELGFTDWRSAQGHELGHAELGLHEGYMDSGGTIACTGHTWTVMDCGSGVRYPQSYDVTTGCAMLKTAWCGSAPPPPLPEWNDASCTVYGGSWIRACFNNRTGTWHGMRIVYYEFKGGQWTCVAECNP